MILFVVVLLYHLLSSALAAKSPRKSADKYVENTYFVTFHDDLEPFGGPQVYNQHLSWIREQQEVQDICEFKVFPCYSAKIPPELKEKIKKRPEVMWVEQVSEIYGSALLSNSTPEQTQNIIVSDIVYQSDSPWVLARISNRGRFTPQDSFRYPAKAGEGVDIYMLDTGIFIQHQQFGGRASFGVSFVEGEAESDAAGHGTFCSGLAAGSTYGVAKRASLISVKVLNSQSLGSGKGIAQGIDWVIAKAAQTGRPSVINLSLEAPRSDTLNRFVDKALEAGIHVVVASGNNSVSACSRSPASSNGITVSASDSFDFFSPFSNDGECVDIFAPGTAVPSCYIGSEIAIAADSGTSQAAAIVSGTIAMYLSEKSFTPSEMKSFLIQTSAKDVLNAVPAGTPNRLLDTSRVF